MTQQPLKKIFNKAVQLEKHGHHKLALKEYLFIIKNDKTFRDAYINLGSLYSRLNLLKESLRCYNAALTLGQDYITYFNLGCIFYKQGYYKNAVMNLEKSGQLNDHFVLTRLVTGLSYSRMNNIKAAETNFKHVLKNWPNNRVALTALAIIFYNEEKYNDAIILLNRLINNDKSNVRIRELKLNILYKIGSIDDSVTEIKSIKRISDGYKYYDDFIKSVPVEVYTDKYGTLDEKIEFLEERADNDNEDLISLSLCHLLKGNTDTAIDYLFKVKKKFEK